MGNLWCGDVALHGPMFSISYSSVLRWVKKLTSLLGAGALGLTTHTFRRSGASELSRQGMSLYGRWLSDRAARSYIRKGEVAVVRARTAAKATLLALSRVDAAKLAEVEEVLFGGSLAPLDDT